MADPERPEQIAEQIVNDAWIFYDERSELDHRKLRETIAAAIHAERAQAARLREALENLSRYEAEELQRCARIFSRLGRRKWADVKAALREAAPEDRSHAK